MKRGFPSIIRSQLIFILILQFLFINQNTFAAEVLKPDLNEKFVPEIQLIQVTGLSKTDRWMVATVEIAIKIKQNGINSIHLNLFNFYDKNDVNCTKYARFELNGGVENGFRKSLTPISIQSIDSTFNIATYKFTSKETLSNERFSYCNSDKYYINGVNVIGTSEHIYIAQLYDADGKFLPPAFVESTWERWIYDDSVKQPPCTKWNFNNKSIDWMAGISFRTACNLTFDFSPSILKSSFILPGLLPKIGTAKKTSSSFEIPILNYSDDYNWKIRSTGGNSKIQDGKIIVSGLRATENAFYFVTTNREGYEEVTFQGIEAAESQNYKDPETLKAEADAKAAADLKAKQEAEAKVAAELQAKQEAEAKVAAEKAAFELKAKQEADAKAAADKVAGEKIIADAKAEAARILASAKAASAKKKTTITCVKGKLIKKVTAVKPVCPKGYKKK
jgi:hypothetical protein